MAKKKKCNNYFEKGGMKEIVRNKAAANEEGIAGLRQERRKGDGPGSLQIDLLQELMEENGEEEDLSDQFLAKEEEAEDGRDNESGQVDMQSKVLLTKNVARRIKEERYKAKEELIGEIFGSREALEAYLQDQKVAKEQKDSQDKEDISYWQNMEEAYSHLLLACRPVSGDIYLRWQSDVEELAEKYQVDRETAFAFLLEEHLPDILSQEREQCRQEILAQLLAGETGPGSLGSDGYDDMSVSSLNEGQFDLLLSKVKGRRREN